MIHGRERTMDQKNEILFWKICRWDPDFFFFPYISSNLTQKSLCWYPLPSWLQLITTQTSSQISSIQVGAFPPFSSCSLSSSPFHLLPPHLSIPLLSFSPFYHQWYAPSLFPSISFSISLHPLYNNLIVYGEMENVTFALVIPLLLSAYCLA